MPASYIISVHTGSTVAGETAVDFANYSGGALKSQVIWVNVWDNPAMISFKYKDVNGNDAWTAFMEFDNSWQPIQMPIAFLGFKHKDKGGGLHARFQVVAQA